MVPDHWSNDAMVSMDRCGLAWGVALSGVRGEVGISGTCVVFPSCAVELEARISGTQRVWFLVLVQYYFNLYFYLYW